jgi:hypothetical protein
VVGIDQGAVRSAALDCARGQISQRPGPGCLSRIRAIARHARPRPMGGLTSAHPVDADACFLVGELGEAEGLFRGGIEDRLRAARANLPVVAASRQRLVNVRSGGGLLGDAVLGHFVSPVAVAGVDLIAVGAWAAPRLAGGNGFFVYNDNVVKYVVKY